jgi:hypothetical protein
MTRLNVHGARCAALFASGLQPSDAPTPEALAEVISRTVRQLGIAGCASRMAQEFGDHPETAASRMRWIRQLISETPAAHPVPIAPPVPTAPPIRTAPSVPTAPPIRTAPSVPTAPSVRTAPSVPTAPPILPGQQPSRPSGWLPSPGPDVHATRPAADRAHRAALPVRNRRACDVSSRPRLRPC